MRLFLPYKNKCHFPKFMNYWWLHFLSFATWANPYFFSGALWLLAFLGLSLCSPCKQIGIMRDSSKEQTRSPCTLPEPRVSSHIFKNLCKCLLSSDGCCLFFHCFSSPSSWEAAKWFWKTAEWQLCQHNRGWNLYLCLPTQAGSFFLDHWPRVLFIAKHWRG